MGAYIINVPSTVDRVIYTNVDPMNGKTYIASYSVDDLTPYTEPDTGAIREEAFKSGYNSACKVIDVESKTNTAYQKGLSDAWEAARKIVLDTDKGGIPLSKLQQVFHKGLPNEIIGAFSASKALEEIRAYEQAQKEKEEQITKGDIVLIKSTPEVEILVTYADEEYVSGIALTEVDGNCEIGDQYTNIRISNIEKTGKHYDIVSVLQKIKEAFDG